MDPTNHPTDLVMPRDVLLTSHCDTALPTDDDIAPLMKRFPPPLGRTWDQQAEILRLAKAYADDLERTWWQRHAWWGAFELGGWIGGLVVLYQWLQTH